MNLHGKRMGLGGVLLAVALGAIAMLALPAIGVGKHGDGDPSRAAGTVRSFDATTGVLTVDLAEGGSISALVVRRTKIRCGEGPIHLRGGASASRHGEEPGDDRGPGREREPGDDDGRGSETAPAADRGRGAETDRGGHGLEPGDDQRPHGDDAVHDHGNHGERCNTSDLVPGAVVKKAEIVLTHGKALFRKIGLLPPHPATTG